MFNFKRKKECLMYSPVNGTTVLIDDVPDKMFATKMLGDGIAFQLDDGNIYSPCNGTLTLVAKTKHAYGFKTENGAEILLHIGLDTVNLNGEGFTVLKPEGSKVKVGDMIAKVDLKFMESKGVNLITPMVLTNGSAYKMSCAESGTAVSSSKDVVMRIES